MHLLIIYTPISHTDAIRHALSTSGAGRIGDYDSCSFSTRGTGRFRPLQGADPAIGNIDELQVVEEERIEVIIPPNVDIAAVLRAVLNAHPYEEPAMHLIKVADYKEFL